MGHSVRAGNLVLNGGDRLFMTVTVLGKPVGKPRMTKRDKWKQRPCVVAYHAWADVARLMAFRKNTKLTLEKPTALTVKAYFQSGKVHRCGPHTVKADLDNVCKAVMDALFLNDQMIYRLTAEKLWCDGGQPRVVIEWD